MADFTQLADQIVIIKAKIDELTSQTLTSEQILYVSQTLQTLANQLGIDDIIAATAQAVSNVEQAGVDTIAVVEGTANGTAVSNLQTSYDDLNLLYQNIEPRTTSLESLSTQQESSIATAVSQALSVKQNDWREITSLADNLLLNKDRIFVNAPDGILTLPPGPNVGDQVYLVDVSGVASTQPFLVERSGEFIQGLDDDLTFNVSDQALLLVYAGSSLGWRIL